MSYHPQFSMLQINLFILVKRPVIDKLVNIRFINFVVRPYIPQQLEVFFVFVAVIIFQILESFKIYHYRSKLLLIMSYSHQNIFITCTSLIVQQSQEPCHLFDSKTDAPGVIDPTRCKRVLAMCNHQFKSDKKLVQSVNVYLIYYFGVFLFLFCFVLHRIAEPQSICYCTSASYYLRMSQMVQLQWSEEANNYLKYSLLILEDLTIQSRIWDIQSGLLLDHKTAKSTM